MIKKEQIRKLLFHDFFSQKRSNLFATLISRTFHQKKKKKKKRKKSKFVFYFHFTNFSAKKGIRFYLSFYEFFCPKISDSFVTLISRIFLQKRNKFIRNLHLVSSKKDMSRLICNFKLGLFH